MPLILSIHILASFFMTGLCWFVQVVHYPLFREIRISDFSAYEKKNFVTGYVTIPVMIIEMLTGLLFLYQVFDTIYMINIILLGVTGLSTVLYQVPIHLKLSQKASPELINKLILTNWIRTISWTFRSGLLTYYLLRLFTRNLISPYRFGNRKTGF